MSSMRVRVSVGLDTVPGALKTIGLRPLGGPDACAGVLGREEARVRQDLES